MANFVVVFNRREQSGKQISPSVKFGGVTQLGQKLTAPVFSGQLEDACVVRVSTESSGAAGIAEAQRGIQHFYPGLVTGTAAVITEEEFKES